MRDTVVVTSSVCNHCNQPGAWDCLTLVTTLHHSPLSSLVTSADLHPIYTAHYTLSTIYTLSTLDTGHVMGISQTMHTPSHCRGGKKRQENLAAFYLSSVFFILLVFCLVSNQSSTKPNWSPRTVVQNIYKSFSLALNLVSSCLHLNLYRMPISMNRSLS